MDAFIAAILARPCVMISLDEFYASCDYLVGLRAEDELRNKLAQHDYYAGIRNPPDNKGGFPLAKWLIAADDKKIYDMLVDITKMTETLGMFLPKGSR